MEIKSKAMNTHETKNKPPITDVAIIGAGPVGLFAVFQCGMLGLKAHVIDALPQIGGQCSALYPEKPIYDIPAYPEITAGELIVQLEKQAAPFAPVYHLNQSIVSICDKDAIKVLKTSAGKDIHARSVIIAAGAGAFGPNRPPLDGIEDYEGTSVFYMIRHKQDFAGQRIVIAGGGDSAVDWANALAERAKNIMLVHRRDKFRAAPESVSRLHQLADNGTIEILTPYQLHALEGANGHLSAVQIKGKDGNIKTVEADILLPFFGLAADLGIMKDWELEVEHHKIVVDPATEMTSQSGIYAIGDIASYKNKLNLILTGFSEAATAAHTIYHQIHPQTELHVEYSTTKGLPPLKN